MDLETISDNQSHNSRRGSKTLILKQIEKSPGIRYRELLRLTGLTNGGLEYHLKILEKSHQVRVDRHDGRRTRYYSLNISIEESNILGCIRNGVARQIVSFILEHDLCTFSEIVEHTKKAPSTVSWHLKRISQAGIISVSFGQDYQLYGIVNSHIVREILCKYGESFQDKVADAYFEMFGEI
jgi:predicted transcriptional regulator